MVDIADAFFDEWKLIEELRMSALTEMLVICRRLHNLREKLSEDMIQILVENPAREYGVTKDLAECTVSLLRAVKGLERRSTMEEVLTNQLGEPSWDSANTTA